MNLVNLSSTRSILLATILFQAVIGAVRAQPAFNYAPLDSPVVSATLSINFAAMKANPFVGTTAVNKISLWDLSSMTALDLTTSIFGTAVWPNPPQVNQGPLQTGYISANVNPSFFGALANGHVGLTALFTDTDDGWFAIDTIRLEITTVTGTTTDAFYGSPANGFGVGIPVGGNLPGPLPGSLPHNGSGFDEPISGKSISAVPEPSSIMLLGLGFLLLLPRGRSFRPFARRGVVSMAGALGIFGALQAYAQPAAIGPAPTIRNEVRNVDSHGREFAPGEVLVVFKPGTDQILKRAAATKSMLLPIAEYSAVGVSHLRVQAGQTVEAAIRALQLDPAVAAASPNYREHPMDNPSLIQPNDPQYPLQWHLNNDGRAVQNIPSVLHAENVTANGFYDAGEAIYEDRDFNNAVSAGDVLISGPAQPNGTALIAFGVDPNQTFIERFADGNGNGRYDAGECLYQDKDFSETVTVGDVRVIACGGPAAGVVAAGAADLCRALTDFRSGDSRPIIDADIDAPQGWVFGTDCTAIVTAVIDSGIDVTHPDLAANIWAGPGGINGASFAGREKHAENINANGLYDNGEAIYLDNDNNNIVSPGDTLLSGPAQPNCTPLVPFFTGQDNRHEKHTEHVVTNQRFDVGEFVYDDLNDDNRVSAGDRRLTAVVVGANNYAVGTVVAAGDADALLALPLVRFVQIFPERHRENVTVNNRFDNGEAVYIDVDRNGRVSIGDQRRTAVGAFAAGSIVAAGNADLGFGLIDFAPDEAHDDGVGVQSAVFFTGDGVYRDNDGSGTVTVGDTRVTPAAGSGLPAGPVGVGNADIGTRIYRFTVWEVHNDPDVDGFYQSPESVINDRDLDGKVSVGDQRMQATFAGAANTMVAAGNGDIGLPLINFFDFNAINERHVDNDFDGLYQAGEALYNDRDKSFDVSAGDIRLTPVGAFAAGSVVAAADADVGDFLADFAVDIQSNDIRDNNGHGTGVAGVIGAVGNNNLNIAGICWRARIMGLRTGFFQSSTIACLDFIRQRKLAGEDIRVVNMSLGGRGYNPALKTAIDNTANAGNGMLFTISAGNDGNNNDPDGQPTETIYRSANNVVTIGDIRITAFGPPARGFPAGSAVAAGNPDLARPLVPFLPIEKYRDSNGNNQYDAGERIYQDMDGSATVTVNDVRMATFNSGGNQYGMDRVAAGDPDIGGALRAFAANERHIDLGVPVYFDGSPVNYPATFNLPRIISVAASDSRDNLASFSNWGLQSVHLAAPGNAILTLRPTSQGGGVQYIDGTSFAAPVVAGVIAHMWSRPANLPDSPELTKLQLLADVNGGALGIPGPHCIDHRYGIRNTVISGGAKHDGRARLDTGDEFGDAPYVPYPTRFNNWGARHEDIGEEWLGRDPGLPAEWVYDLPIPPPPPTGASPEYDDRNNAAWPPDPDGVQNMVDMDADDHGVMLLGPFRFSPPVGPLNQATVRVFINTANNGVADGAAGRYASPGANPLGESPNVPGDGVHGINDNRNVWVNAWFDWNRNGSFDDPTEHVFMLGCNPAAFAPAQGGVYHVTFNMPRAPTNAQIGGAIWARFRLDYGENAGQSFPVLAPILPHDVGPSPAGQVRFWDDPPGLPFPGPIANRWETVPVNPFVAPVLYAARGLARYGEVEDYLISGGQSDQIHLYGPNPNSIPINVTQTLKAMVENNFVGLPGQSVIFSVASGGIQFTSGALGGGGASSTVVTDPYGAASVTFVGTNAGPALISATDGATGMTAYQFLQVLANRTMVIERPSPQVISLQLAVNPGEIYTIQRSIDLINWEDIATATAPDSGPTRGLIVVTDAHAPLDRAFYRAHRE